MSYRWPTLLCLVPLFLSLSPSSPATKGADKEKHRSPIELAILPGARYAVTANHTADSASLIDLEQGKVIQEVPCGKKPGGIACSSDGTRIAVSNLWSGTLTLLERKENKLRSLAEIPVGFMPRGIVFAPDGKSLYVALAGADEVVELDLQGRKVSRRWPAAREPRRVVLSRDGSLLLASCSRSTQVRCWDTRTGKPVWIRTITDSFNLFGLTITPDDQEVITAQVRHRYHSFVPANIDQGWALDNRLANWKLRPEKDEGYNQLALDIRGLAVGDPSAVACSDDGNWTVVAAPGTQELLLMQRKTLPWKEGDPGDFIDGSLESNAKKFRRLSVGGRPLSIGFLPKSSQLIVANYLLDAVQIVDVQAGKVMKTISLGAPVQKSQVRLGEQIYYDAKRSRHQWYSCHTCHPDGHTSGRIFDTVNDNSGGNPKLAPSLRGVTHTSPWTWHGWQESLEASVKKSLLETLWGPKPSDQDVKAVVAFLGTLEYPPNPYLLPGGKRTAAAERGKAIFHGKARCDRCHQGEHYTSKKNFDVKLPPDGSEYDTWNPPTLRGVHDRGPFLHDGSAESLDQVLRGAHAPERLGAKALTPAERADLIAFLKSL